MKSHFQNEQVGWGTWLEITYIESFETKTYTLEAPRKFVSFSPAGCQLATSCATLEMLSHLNIPTGETSQAMMHNIKESDPHQTAKKLQTVANIGKKYKKIFSGCFPVILISTLTGCFLKPSLNL